MWYNSLKIRLLFLFFASQLKAQIYLSEYHQMLADSMGKPFFWLGDTDWELFHRLNREEAAEFIQLRSEQGFNVLMIATLAEEQGIRSPNRYGDFPLNNEDPTQFLITPGANPENTYEYDYWDHVDYVIDQVAKHQMYIGLLPIWGDKVARLWGKGPVIFNVKNAREYGVLLAKRYENRKNILWILGGDRLPVYDGIYDGEKQKGNDIALWRAMAEGIESVLGNDAFITYHPSGGKVRTSDFFHEEPWLDMNAFQSGHGARESDPWNWVSVDLTMNPKKPTLDLEPCYEDHPVNPWDGKWTRAGRGYFDAYDVRARIYRTVFAGACGVSYGHHQVWQFLNAYLYPPINVGDTIIGWERAAKSPAAYEMAFLKKLMLSRPYFSRKVDQTIIASPIDSSYQELMVAFRNEASSFAMIYLPQNKEVKIDFSKITGKLKYIWWYDPRTGSATSEKPRKGNKIETFIPPPSGKDWVLVIDDAFKGYAAPGKF
ncbi:MAG: glycoside hydrolase family 140 protein [Saprospiraceae bacterium]